MSYPLKNLVDKYFNTVIKNNGFLKAQKMLYLNGDFSVSRLMIPRNELSLCSFKDVSDLNLSGMDFSGMDLSNCDFSNTILKYCNFKNTMLNNTDFNKAIIHNSSFQGANINVSFDKADVFNTCFSETNRLKIIHYPC